jgi:ferric-dicitrate binding protein FerR (iron transport regulator)
LILEWKVTHPKRPASIARTTDASATATSVFIAEGGPVATVLSAGGYIQPLLPGQTWHPGDHLRTVDLPVALTANDQSSVEVEPYSDLQLLRSDAERWLNLGSGAVEVHVAKLKAGERFVIATPDAEVEVRGTRFHLAIVPAIRGCGQGTVTRVSVTEGIVVVRSSGVESRVLAGTRWPFGCQRGQVSVLGSGAAEKGAIAADLGCPDPGAG